MVNGQWSMVNGQWLKADMKTLSLGIVENIVTDITKNQGRSI
jgi:hypothetical protein